MLSKSMDCYIGVKHFEGHCYALVKYVVCCLGVIPVMALTATATKMLQRKVAGTLGMHRTILFSVSLCKRNMFAMATPYNSIEVIIYPLLMCLAMEIITMPRTIIYCLL